jgi:hypothetical protein
MKLIRSSVMSGLIVCGLAIVTANSVVAQTTEQGIAKVVDIQGSARYMTADSPTWRPLKSGAVLKPGTTIQTASDSHVDLVLNDPKASATTSSALNSAASSSLATPASHSTQPKAEQDAIRITENTVLGLDKLSITQTGADKVTDTELDLKAGRIIGLVKKMPAASKYEVRIPNGVAGIRGTIFSISVDGILAVLSGDVWISIVGTDGNPVTTEVKAGQQFDPKTGQMSTIPDALYQEMLLAASDFAPGVAGMARVMSMPDHTVYFLSNNQDNQGNQNQGGNQQ